MNGYFKILLLLEILGWKLEFKLSCMRRNFHNFVSRAFIPLVEVIKKEIDCSILGWWWLNLCAILFSVKGFGWPGVFCMD